MRLGIIPELSREQLEKKFPRKGYCITFYPVEDGELDIMNVEQIFPQIDRSKSERVGRAF